MADISQAHKDWQHKQDIEIIINNDNVSRKTLLPALFVLMLCFLVLGVPYPWRELSALMIVYSFVSIVVIAFIKRGWGQPMKLYFWLAWFLNVLCMLTMHYTGGIASFVFPIYTTIMVLVALTLTGGQVVVILLIAVLTYFAEVFSEAAGWVPRLAIFPELFRSVDYAVSPYVRVVPVANVMALVAITYLAYQVSLLLKKRREQLISLNEKLLGEEKLARQREGENLTLHEETEKKIAELEDLKAHLEEKVREKTASLMSKVIELDQAGQQLNAKIAELNETHNLITLTGRRQQVETLKKEVDGLLGKLGRPPKYRD
jgi:hypothetical protein